MQSSRLGLAARLLVALVAVLAFGAIAAVAAEAAAPFWTVEREGGKVTRLVKGETSEITVKDYKAEPIVLEAELVGVKAKVECTEASLGAGSELVGSSGNEPASSKEVAKFSKCKTVNTGKECKVKEPIETKPIRNELVESVTEPKTFLVEFDPEAGTEAEFVTLHFEGEHCVVTETVVGKGLVVGSLYTDEEITKKAPEAVLASSKEVATSWLVKFPDTATEVLLWSENSKKEFESLKKTITQFKAFGNPAKLTGTVLVLLKSGGKFGQEN